MTGDIPLSAVLDDLGEVFLARYEPDGWHYYSREDLGIPAGAPRARDLVRPVAGGAE